MRHRQTAICVWAGIALSAVTSGSVIQVQSLPVGVGKSAPPLVLSRWLRGTPIDQFKKGQIYVVESWATWCQPCVKSMPHLTELQSRFGHKVQIIGVDIWEQDQKAAGPFLTEMGDKVGYSIAQDLVPSGKTGFDGKFAKDWIEGAGKYSFGVPLAFVINGDGVVAWIGHPSQLDAPLKQIVDGKWDLSAAKHRYDAEMREALKTERFKVAYYHASLNHNWTAAAEACDKVITIDPTPNAYFASNEFRTLYSDAGQPARAFEFARAAIKKRFASNPAILTALAQAIASTRPKPDSKEISLALEAADRSVKLTHGQDSGPLSALAQVWSRKGDTKKAISLIRKAIQLARTDSDKTDLAEVLASIKRGG